MPKKKTETTPLAAAKPAAKARATRAATPKVAKARKPNGASAQAPAPSFHEIAEAAYLRYVSRGGTAGSDFDDWLEAERELSQRYQRSEAEG